MLRPVVFNKTVPRCKIIVREEKGGSMRKCAYCHSGLSIDENICPSCGFDQKDKPSFFWNLYGLVFPPFCWLRVTRLWKKPKSPKLRCARFVSYGAALNIIWYFLTGFLDYDILKTIAGDSVILQTIGGIVAIYIDILLIPTLWILLASWLYSPKRQYKPGVKFFYG